MCRTTCEIIDIHSPDLLISLIKENMQFEKYSYLMFKKKRVEKEANIKIFHKKFRSAVLFIIYFNISKEKSCYFSPKILVRMHVQMSNLS